MATHEEPVAKGVVDLSSPTAVEAYIFVDKKGTSFIKLIKVSNQRVVAKLRIDEVVMGYESKRRKQKK